MTQNTYQIAFSGAIVPGANLTQVKKNVAGLFKTDLARVELLFSGNRVVVKKGLDHATALKYQAALKQAGILVQIVDTARAPQQARPRPPAQPRPAVPPQAPPARPTGGGAVKAPAAVKGSPAPVAGNRLSVAEPGVTLVESRPVPEPVFNLSGLSLAEPGVDLVQHEKVQPLQVDLRGLTMAEPGVTLVEHEETPPAKIDTSRLGLS